MKLIINLMFQKWQIRLWKNAIKLATLGCSEPQLKVIWG